MTSELKPCPFCGAQNRGEMLDIYPASPSYGHSNWRVVCDDCGAEGPTVKAYNSDDSESLCERAWNTRATDPELAGLRAENERLRSALDRWAVSRGFLHSWYYHTLQNARDL